MLAAVVVAVVLIAPNPIRKLIGSNQPTADDTGEADGEGTATAADGEAGETGNQTGESHEPGATSGESEVAAADSKLLEGVPAPPSESGGLLGFLPPVDTGGTPDPADLEFERGGNSPALTSALASNDDLNDSLSDASGFPAPLPSLGEDADAPQTSSEAPTQSAPTSKAPTLSLGSLMSAFSLKGKSEGESENGGTLSSKETPQRLPATNPAAQFAPPSVAPPSVASSTPSRTSQPESQPERSVVKRLPQTDEPSLPRGTLGRPVESGRPDRNLVLFARELVQLRVLEDWFVTEAAAGRDVRLVMSPTKYKDHLEHGMWIACHVLQGPETRDAQESLLTDRIAAITRQRAQNISTQPMTIGEWTGVRGNFTMEIEPVKVGPASQRQPKPRKYDGFHAVVTTPWALVELHGIAPAESDGAMGQLDSLVSTMELRSPKPWPSAAKPQTQEAAAIHGVWKSSRGRMRIYGSGRVDLETDRSLLLSSPASRQQAEGLNVRPGAPRLRGAYRATGDLLRITWEDGSQLNLRWKLSKGNLLMTDHLGQISKLKPLLE